MFASEPDSFTRIRGLQSIHLFTNELLRDCRYPKPPLEIGPEWCLVCRQLNSLCKKCNKELNDL